MKEKKSLYIIGAGGFGREIESWLSEISEEKRDWELKGYIDDNLNALDNFPTDYKILSSIEDFVLCKSDYIIVALGNSESRSLIYEKLKGKVNFFTFISPKATIAKFVNIGEGSVICPNTIVSTNVRMGKFSIVNCGTQIGHDVHFGNFLSIMTNVNIGGSCQVGDNVFFGSKSTLIQDRKVCSNVIIGAGATVFRNISKEGTYIGNPAIRLK